MPLTLQKLENQLSKEQISPLYFIMGPETFLIKEGIKRIKSRVLSPEAQDFNYEVFTAKESDIHRVREAIETLPVFSPKRLLVFKQAHRLKESDWKLLAPLVSSPLETCVLVFVSEAPDKRKKIIKELMSHCTTVSAEAPKEKDWSAWLGWMGKKEGVSFSESAAALIKDYACSDLMNLETEITKLKTLLGSKTHISEEDVLSVIPRVRTEDIFALSKAIGKKDLSSALTCLARLLEDNHNEIGALSLISRHMRILIRIKEGIKRGHTEQTLCHKTGVPRFFIHQYIQEANMWTDKKITSALEALKATDKALKSSPVSSHIWLENFIIRTCST